MEIQLDATNAGLGASSMVLRVPACDPTSDVLWVSLVDGALGLVSEAQVSIPAVEHPERIRVIALALVEHLREHWPVPPPEPEEEAEETEEAEVVVADVPPPALLPSPRLGFTLGARFGVHAFVGSGVAMLGPALHFEAPVSVFRVHLHLGAGWGTEPSAVAKLTSVVASAALLFGGQSRAFSLYAGPFGGLQWTRVEGVPFDASAVQGDVVRNSSPLFGARAAFRARLASALQLEVGVDVGFLAGGVDARFTAADASTMRVASVSGVFIDASIGLALEL